MTSPPTSLTPSSISRIDTLLRSSVEQKLVPPFLLSAFTADSELYSEAAGLDKDGNPFGKDTVLRIFSMTKLVTSIAILQLIEKGKLSLDTEGGTYLAGLVAPNILTGYSDDGQPVLVPAKNRVTIMHLLNHSSGLALDTYSPDLKRYMAEKDWTKVSSEERHFGLPLIFEPGTSWCYSPATDYLGRIVEIVSGVSLEEYFQTNILQPLSMTSTSFNLSPHLKPRATLPLAYRDPTTHLLLPTVPKTTPYAFFDSLPDTMTINFGAWGLWSSLGDYALLVQHLLSLAPNSRIAPKVERIINEESWKSLFEGTLGKEAKERLEVVRRVKVPVPGVDWSTALFVNEVDWEGRRKAGSGGWGGMAHTHFSIDPMTGVGLIGGTQLLPQDDANVPVLWTKFEEEVYAGLEL